mmetsp:Transcript_11080/g.31356  ORF Transcript_11080/g.31356 Transcript_11080/m.31356 type:complete len:187 (+) Transcript_11080:331-891(+)
MRCCQVNPTFQDAGLFPLSYELVKGRCNIQDMSRVPQPAEQDHAASGEAPTREDRDALHLARCQKLARQDGEAGEEDDICDPLLALRKRHLAAAKEFDEHAFTLKARAFLKKQRELEAMEAKLELMATAKGEESFSMTTAAVLAVEPRQLEEKARSTAARIFTCEEAVLLEKAKKNLSRNREGRAG